MTDTPLTGWPFPSASRAVREEQHIAEAVEQARAEMRASLTAQVRVADVNTCPDCHGDGWTAETTADPNEFGEPGEPYQYQAVCSHAGLYAALIEDRP
jgi:hypothetical protein